MPEIVQVPYSQTQDLAGYEVLSPSPAPFQLWIGGVVPVTDSAKSAVASAKQYEIMALLPAGTLTTFIAGTHTAQQCVVAAQAVNSVGQDVPYWDQGKFNHEALVWPTGSSFDTYIERKAFFTGTNIRVGHLI